MPKVIEHDPNATLDYRFDWGGTDWRGQSWLGEDTITAATVTGTGVTVNSTTNDATTVTTWVTGGDAGTQAKLVCHITTAAGRQDERTMYLAVRNR